MKPKIIIPADCGNAPKKIFVKEFNTAFAENDNTYILNHVTDDIVWNIVGEKQIQGKEKFAQELERLRNIETVELILTTVITHGYNGAANGILKFNDGRTIAFCDIYVFASSKNNAKIRQITSYVIHNPS